MQHSPGTVSITSVIHRSGRSGIISDNDIVTTAPSTQEIEAKSGTLFVLLFAFLVGILALVSVYLSFPALAPLVLLPLCECVCVCNPPRPTPTLVPP